MVKYSRSKAEGKLDNKMAKLFRKRLNFGSKPKVSQPVKTYVKRVVSSSEETKCASLNTFNQQTTLGYGLNSVTFLGLTSTQSILPLVTQGADQAQRIGNKIKVTSCYLRYSLRAQNVTNAGVNDNPFSPFLVRIIAYSRKLTKADNDNTRILQNGNTAGAFGSAPETWLEPYNRDAYNIHYSKQFLMVPPRRVTGSTAPNQYAQDAIVEGAKSFVMKRVKLKGLPKTFIYDDASGGSLANKPVNTSVYLAVAVCNADGSIVGATTDQRCMVNADTFLYYKDS